MSGSRSVQKKRYRTLETRKVYAFENDKKIKIDFGRKMNKLYELSSLPNNKRGRRLSTKTIQNIELYDEVIEENVTESLVEASIFVKTIEDKMGLKISCPEEIAYTNGWISKDKLLEIGNTMAKNQYGQHLLNVANGKVKLL